MAVKGSACGLARRQCQSLDWSPRAPNELWKTASRWFGISFAYVSLSPSTLLPIPPHFLCTHTHTTRSKSPVSSALKKSNANLSIRSFRFVRSSWWGVTCTVSHSAVTVPCGVVSFDSRCVISLKDAESIESGGSSERMHPHQLEKSQYCAADLRNAFRPRRARSAGIQKSTYWTQWSPEATNASSGWVQGTFHLFLLVLCVWWM